MNIGPIYMNGHYDDNGNWQRTKFCLVSCGDRCDCGPPGMLWYSTAHDKNKLIKRPKNPDELLREAMQGNEGITK